MFDLNNAIQLIRQGQKQEAQKILEPLLQSDPTNIQAWFWYVETYPTLEKRVKVLETCLKMNPGNAQVIQALSTLDNQRAAQPSSTPPAAAPKPAESQARIPYSSLYDDEPKSSTAASTSSYFDEKPVRSPATGTSSQPAQNQQKKAWEQDLNSYVDNSTLSKPKSAARSYAFYDVWMTVLFSFDIESYQAILDDPEASAGRAFEWIAYAGIFSGLIAPLSLVNNPEFAKLMATPEFSGLFGNMSTTALMVILALVLALVVPISSVIGLAISGGIQNVLAGFFGGNGYFGRTVYAIAAYTAPITILISLLGIIPLAGQCLTSLLSLYTIVLNVRALRAAHSISTWQALGVMFTPGIIFMVLGCLVLFAVGVPGLSR